MILDPVMVVAIIAFSLLQIIEMITEIKKEISLMVCEISKITNITGKYKQKLIKSWVN